MNKKNALIQDIENLLNGHENISQTTINPELLGYMDEETLKNIIASLLDQKEDSLQADTEWLEQFKRDKN